MRTGIPCEYKVETIDDSIHRGIGQLVRYAHRRSGVTLIESDLEIIRVYDTLSHPMKFLVEACNMSVCLPYFMPNLHTHSEE